MDKVVPIRPGVLAADSMLFTPDEALERTREIIRAFEAAGEYVTVACVVVSYSPINFNVTSHVIAGNVGNLVEVKGMLAAGQSEIDDNGLEMLREQQ